MNQPIHDDELNIILLKPRFKLKYKEDFKKFLFNEIGDENIQKYADQSGLSFKEAKEVFDLIMGKGGMKGKKTINGSDRSLLRTVQYANLSIRYF